MFEEKDRATISRKLFSTFTHYENDFLPLEDSFFI